MQNLFGLDVGALAKALEPLALPSYRLKQIAAWIYRRGATAFDEMTDLSQNLRSALARDFVIDRGLCQAKLASADEATVKFLISFADGAAVECVYMRHDYGHSICISSQVGCPMGCAFCASTLKGLKRNLTAGEMMAQAVFINEFLRRQSGSEKKEGCLLDNMVIMGSGEPLLNYREVLKFLRLIHSPEGFNFGYRRITVSTSGIVPQIYALADENIPVTLSISLHAPNDELRSRLMPVNRKYPIDELLRAGRAYGEKTGRRVTYEYVLIGGVNDGSEEARELADLIKGDLAAVNLIPLNPVSERDFKKPTHKRVCAFADVLAAQNIAVTVRKEMGSDIAAACGQLVSRFEAARQNSK